MATDPKIVTFPEAEAESVFARNKKLVETNEPLMEEIDELRREQDQAIADEHDIMERKYASLDRRIRSLEGKGMILPDINDEKILFYLAAAYFVFNFIVPAVVRLIDREDEPAKS